MSGIASNLWLIPALPLVAAGVSALAPQRRRTLAATLAIGAMAVSLGLAIFAFATTLRHSGSGDSARELVNFPWFQFGDAWLSLGWVLDPLTAVMLVMVTFVGLLIFIYSVGYMAHDENFTRFFCFLSLFGAAMLGVVIANSLLLLFICWELVGLTSYLLIGFWYHKPSAAAAAKKAFVTTRIGDLAFLLGMLWLYSQTGTLLFYDNGRGCLEQDALVRLVSQSTSLGIAASTGIGLLIFCGAIGKSGQVPLHVWLPDAMEGPTPVSALIHAATMVAAGVFLVARVYPLMAATPLSASTTLQVITWVGTLTALLAASIAVVQTDIKRILAYSTVSQLGFMMVGLGTGGVAVGMFHLITHAFFKALLFLGAGSVIHGCHEEQDVRRLGGLRQQMPVTFATYAVGMLALSGFPLLFSGFWSKDEILHAAHGWHTSRLPFYLGIISAGLTAFYMTRQMIFVFFGTSRLATNRHSVPAPHESPAIMTVPLVILAVFAVFLGFLGTPAWPWFGAFLEGHSPITNLGALTGGNVESVMLLSTAAAFAGFGLGYGVYGRRSAVLSVRSQPSAGAGQAVDHGHSAPGSSDPLERWRPDLFTLLDHKFFFDEIYEASIVRFNAWCASACAWMDLWIWNGLVQFLTHAVLAGSWISRALDEYVVNLGFDATCRRLGLGGGWLGHLQNGRVQHYLRAVGIALVALLLILVWGCHAS